MMNKVVPKQVIVEVTSRCNLSCKYCPNLKDDNPKDMSLESFKEIVEKIGDENVTVIPWMNGEPLLHPEYDKMLEVIVDKGLRCYVTTNGTVWNDRVGTILAQNNSIYQIIVSLDGLHTVVGGRSIELARPGTDRKQVVASVRSYKNWVEQYSPEETDVAVKICERGQDYEEIEEYVKFWLREVDFVVVGKRLGQENDESMRIYPCQYFDNNFMVIRADGKLVPCAYHDGMVNKDMYPLGNIFDYDSIVDAYNNERYKELRSMHRSGQFNVPCDTCSFAYTGKGFKGVVEFKGFKDAVYFHQDYYNQFFSLKPKFKPDDYYGFLGEAQIQYQKR